MIHGAVHSLFRLLAATATLILVGLAIVAWRLSDGPISMDFLAPYVADALNIDDGKIQFGVKGAVLSWGGFRESPEIRVLDITAIDESGQVIAAFPKMTVQLSLRSILEGVPAPQEIILANPVVRLTRTNEGRLLFGLDPDDSGKEETRSTIKNTGNSIESEAPYDSENILLEMVVQALSYPGGSKNLPGYLERVTIKDATVVFRDQKSGAEWLVPSGNIELQRDQEELRLQASLPYVNAGTTSEVAVKGVYVSDSQSLSLSIDFQAIRPSSFSPLFPQLPIMSAMGIDVSGTLGLDLLLSSTSLSVSSARIEINQGQGRVDLPAPIERQYPVDHLELVARATQNFDQIVIDSMNLNLKDSTGTGPNIELKLVGTELTSSPKVSVALGIDEVTLNELKTYWPRGVKSNTRNWITRNLNNGSLSNVKIDIELEGDSVESINAVELSGSGTLENIDVTYIQQMPPVEHTFGALTLSLSEVGIDITGGQINQLSTGGQLDIHSGRVRLHGLDTLSHMADIDVRINGRLNDAIALIKIVTAGLVGSPTIASALGITPLSTTGDVQVLLGLDFPLIQDLSLANVQIAAQASLEQTRVDNTVFGLDLESGQFSLSLDNFGMDVSGTASLGGIRTGLAWRQNFIEGSFRRQYALDAVVENDQRRLIGLDQTFFGPPYIDGPARIEAIYTVSEDNSGNLALEVDLKGASLSIPQVNWRKHEGVDAIFSADIRIIDERLASIDKFTALSRESDLNVQGQARFFEDNSLISLELAQSTIGNSHFSVNVVRASDDILDISAEGAVLDGTAFWSTIRQNDQSRSFQDQEKISGRMPFRFKGRFERLLLSSEGELTDVKADIVQEVSGLSEIVLNGMVNDGELFSLSMHTDGDNRAFKAKSANSGAVLRALGLSDDFVNGELSVSGSVLDTGAVDGTFSINSFTIVDAPLLARLLSVASLTGIVDELRGSGISFSDLNVPFSYSDNVFTIRDGAMYGASLGLTAQGKYDIDKNTIDGDGTIIPAYALNSVLGSIPILGTILTGGEESGGVFAATFAIRGNPEGAEITVNPLATLAPGFLRQIFKIFDPPPASSSAREVTDSSVEGSD